MIQITPDELVEALAARESVLNAENRVNAGGIIAAALPEFTEEDRHDFLAIVMASFPRAGNLEFFIRGIECGRELERRANVHRVES